MNGLGHSLMAASGRVIVESRYPDSQPHGFLFPITLGLQTRLIYMLKTHSFAGDLSHETHCQQRLSTTQKPYVLGSHILYT